MKIYHYARDTKAYVGESKAKRDPEEKDRFLIPANATTLKPSPCNKEHENVFIDGAWVCKRIKTEQPSDYHVWSEEEGWTISAEDQALLDKEREDAETLEKARSAIEKELRLMAIERLIEKGILPETYKEA